MFQAHLALEAPDPVLARDGSQGQGGVPVWGSSAQMIERYCQLSPLSSDLNTPAALASPFGATLSIGMRILPSGSSRHLHSARPVPKGA